MSDGDEDAFDEPHSHERKRLPYNKGACRQCGVAKTKCIPIPGNRRCERCEKLNRECSPRTTTHRKRRIAAPATTARVANLEQKLDSIVSLLSTNKDSTSEYVTPATIAASSAEPEHQSSEVPSPYPAANTYPVTNNGHDVHASVVSKRARETQAGSKCGVPLTEATPLRDSLRPADTHLSAAGSPLTREINFGDGELDEMLLYYRTCSTTFFPFVLVPDGTGFAERHQTSPFLYDVISYVTSARDFKRQVALGEKLLEDIAHRLLLRPEKTEELLSGMLLFATWNHIMFPINGQLTTMLHMMKSIIVNLQYDRPPGSVNRRLLFMKGYINSQIRQMAKDVTPRSLTEQRAVLGCYYLTSVRCMLAGSLPLDHIECYPYLQECATTLENMQDQPTDVALAHMVRLQSVVDKINKTLPRGDNPGLVTSETRVPTYMAMKVLQAELADRKNAWPAEVKSNTTLILQHYAAEVFLYETTMIEYLREKCPMDQLQTVEMLNNCMVAIRSYLVLYRTIPQWQYAYLPFTMWIQCGLVLQAAVELLFFEHVGWDLHYARAQLDLLGFIDFEMRGIQAVADMRGTSSPPSKSFEGLEMRDIFQRFLRRKINMKSAYEQRLAAEQQAPGADRPSEMPQDWSLAGASTAIPSLEDIYMGGLYYDFDNGFWQDYGVGPSTWASVGSGVGAPDAFNT